MTSPYLKLGISLLVSFTAPFIEGHERIIDWSVACLGKNDQVLLDLISDLVAFLQMKSSANRLRDSCLRLGCKLARYNE